MDMTATVTVPVTLLHNLRRQVDLSADFLTACRDGVLEDNEWEDITELVTERDGLLVDIDALLPSSR